MKVILAILSLSFVYASSFEYIDKYIASNHSQELNRADLSPEILRTEVTTAKALVETAKKRRLVAEHDDMDNSLYCVTDPTARQRVINDHDNKKFSQIEQAFDQRLEILNAIEQDFVKTPNAKDNIISSGNLQKAWQEILRIKVAAEMIIIAN